VLLLFQTALFAAAATAATATTSYRRRPPFFVEGAIPKTVMQDPHDPRASREA